MNSKTMNNEQKNECTKVEKEMKKGSFQKPFLRVQKKESLVTHEIIFLKIYYLFLVLMII